MRYKKSKLTWAVASITCALAGVAVQLAWATPGRDISTTIIAGPSSLDDVRVKTHSEINKVEFATKGDSDVYVVQNVIKPGGHTGWHTHPGPSIISVVSGQVTEYRSDEPDGIVHEAGSVFVDEGGDHAHIMVNEGSTNLVLVAFQVLPAGAPRRIDLPEP